MTLPPEKIGDKGQRYEVSVSGYPKEGWNVVGWANDKGLAIEMGQSLRSAPRAKAMCVTDRQGDEEPWVQEWVA